VIIRPSIIACADN